MDPSKLDDAARAGWLYYVAGNTQDEIARKLGISRQGAQRLVATAVSERLVKVRIDHPIALCMELAERAAARFSLRFCEIVPSDPAAPGSISGIANAAAGDLERRLRRDEAQTVAFGTGRTLKGAVAEMPRMNCPRHRIVSLLGNLVEDGSATPYNVVIRLAERTGARHYPMPLPAFVGSRRELELWHAREPIRNTISLCRAADVTFVGIGQMDETAPIMHDGFISDVQRAALIDEGAVGEITSWIYDRDGNVMAPPPGMHATSVPVEPRVARLVVGVAAGPHKVAAMAGALAGGLVNGVITDEATIDALLSD